MVIASTLFYRRRVFDDNDAAQGGRIIKWGAVHLLGAVSRAPARCKSVLWHFDIVSGIRLETHTRAQTHSAHAQHPWGRRRWFPVFAQSVCNTFDVEEWSMTSNMCIQEALFAYQFTRCFLISTQLMLAWWINFMGNKSCHWKSTKILGLILFPELLHLLKTNP